MADEENVAAQEEAPENIQNIENEKLAGIAAAEPSPHHGIAGVVDLPIEGDSKWVLVMRSLAIATIVGIFVIAGVVHFLTGDNAFVETQQLAMIMSGIVFILVLEYFVFLLVVIPRQADYGRYMIRENQVDFYPLTHMGLGISTQRKPESISKFMGITARPLADKSGKTAFAVYLVHKTDKGKSINIRSFDTAGKAEEYAGKLGNTLRLNVAMGIRAKKKRAV